jgi:uncharacterized membrane protein YfcA
MDFSELAIAVVAGFIAGIINTLAGSGSVFTLPVLMFLGLSPHHANNTDSKEVPLMNLESTSSSSIPDRTFHEYRSGDILLLQSQVAIS